ncbi:cell wall-binding repeat-containing protein [Agromyces humatus]|uniref:Alpha-amylase n=1 Tax=Agromyces humatus TaxID=279573 RepID=A0ABP4X8D4_9MICO|nr:cell wall-binding repeat-containing protein [Agromyces humatus]
MTRTRATALAAKATTALTVAALVMFGTPAMAQAHIAPRDASGSVAMAEPIAAGSISGTVTEPTGEPADGLVPTIYRPDSRGVLVVVEGIGESQDAGAYTVSGLPPGDYFAVVPGDGPIVDATLEPGAAATWYGGTMLPGVATAIHVEAGQTVTGIDITRVKAAIITGQLTTIDGPLEGAYVSAGAAAGGAANILWAWRNLSVSARTDSAGRYAFALSPGVDYSLSFGRSDASVISESWDDVPEGAGLSPTYLNLEPGEVRHGIDAELAKPVTIAGTVRDAAGAPVADADIHLHTLQVDGPNPILGSIITDVDGRFEISQLRPGTYAFEVVGPWPLVREFWKDQPDLASATPIVLGSGERLDALVEVAAPPPIPSAIPTITGSALVGSKLTAVTNGWAPGASFSYQWLADGEALYGERGRTLNLWPRDEGKAFSVRVTGWVEGYLGVAETSAATSRVMQSDIPTINGRFDSTVWVGETVYARPGTWSASTTFTYQWYADGIPIEGATASSLLLPTTVTGKAISVKVTGTKAGYTTHSETSAPTPGAGRKSTPTVSGTPYVGATLSASPGVWTPGTTFSYEWYADHEQLTGENESTLTLPASLVGKQIRAIVSGQLAGYPTPVEWSAPTLRVALAPTPEISGEPYVGTELTVSHGTWEPATTFTYQWYADGVAISGATASFYTVASTLIGKTLTVRVTGSLSEYPTITRTSAATPRVSFESNARLAGGDRFGTSAAISRGAFAPRVPVVYIANGLNFPDALSGAPVAATKGGPVLLTGSTYLPWTVIDELERLEPQRIVVLGGTGAISDILLNTLKPYTSGSVTRLAGGDRFATSAAISKASFSAGVPVAYVANGLNFPDALSGAPVAGIQGGPVLLARATSIPASVATELKRLKPKRIVVLGGTGVTTPTLQNALKAYTSGSVTRLAGGDRFATSAAISKASFPAGVPVAYVANGMTFPDALSGAPAAGVQGGPVLLTQRNTIPASVVAELKRLKPKRVVVLGGPGAVSDAVRAQLNAYLAR